MRDLPGFDAFAADQAQPLARTALSLTGDPEAARALVVTALSVVAARWRTVRWSFPTHAAREALYAAYLKRPRARRAARGPGRLAPGRLAPDTDAAALAEALTGLTPRRRALVAACFHDGHTTWQAAGLCRMDARTANTETVLAVAELRDRLPASFVTGGPPEPGAEPAPDETPQESDASPPAGAVPQEGPAPEGPGPEGSTSWASPSAAGPAEITPSAAPFVPPAASVSLPGNSGPGDRGEGPWEAALRRELAVLSARMPALDPVPLTAEATRIGRRQGTRRRALVTTMSVTLTALVVVPLAFGAAGLFGRAGQSANGGSPGVLDENAAVPTLPPSLPAPVRFAYRGFCTADDWDVLADEFADSGCAQWRVVATTGEQWRVADVSPVLSDGWQPLLAISGDGNRLVYFSAASSDFVMVDRLDTTTRRTDMVPLAEEVSPEDTHVVISPGGRWMAADFGPAADALRPRLQNLTTYRVRTLPRRMRVLAVSDDGTVTGTASWDSDAVPGRITTTVLLRVGPDGRTLSRTPVDSALFEDGAAVSPDGRAVAVAVERAHPAKGDHGLLVTLDSTTGRVLTRREAALPEDAHVFAVRGWANEHEVIVEVERILDDADEEEPAAEYSVHAVDVRTGAARPIMLDQAGVVPALWVPGTLR
ncbi:hypothetical protein AB0J37_18395 [Microbispora rosea]|uniref:hypothetical protein n=1 Tax=Microbispora rosea TaxID=58117 RepID=UPI0034245B44